MTMFGWLAPVFSSLGRDDKEFQNVHRNIAQLIALLVAGLVLISLLSHLVIFRQIHPFLFPFTLLVICINLVFCWRFRQANSITLSAIIYASSLTVLWSFFLYNTSGHLGEVMMFGLLIPMFTAFLFNRWVTVGFVLYCSLSVFIVGFLHIQQHDFAPRTGTTEQHMWLTFIDSMAIIVAASFIGRYYAENMRRLAHEVNLSANVDHLTGLANRRSIEQQLEQELLRAKRQNDWLNIGILDIDHFKSINDSYGHDLGDKCLVEVAKKLTEHTKRASDASGRLGGEEFLIFFSSEQPGLALQHFERLRQTICKMKVAGANGDVHSITVTIGVLSCHSQQLLPLMGMLNKADAMLYRGKEQGRNRVIQEVVNNSGESQHFVCLDNGQVENQ